MKRGISLLIERVCAGTLLQPFVSILSALDAEDLVDRDLMVLLLNPSLIAILKRWSFIIRLLRGS